MNAIKKTVLATAVLMSMGAGAAQAAVTNFDFVGSFVMYDGSGYDPMFLVTGGVVDNGNGAAGDPVLGTMSIDDMTGAGSATMTGQPFFGSTWLATGITLQATGPGMVTANMLFHWGDAGVGTSWLGGVDNGLGSGTCGLTNCDIGVTVGFAMMPTANPMAFSVTTVTSEMPAGPFAGFQPTFNGTATVQMPAAVPVPAAAWLLGSGLLGLVGVARRKAA